MFQITVIANVYQCYSQEKIINNRKLALVAPDTAEQAAVTSVTAEEVRAELQRILASRCFAKARRSAELLDFLVLRTLLGALRDNTEYLIGIEVFRRKAGSYHTGDDPIVRVQAGRLRTRLAAYYAEEGRRNPVRITVPQGAYLAQARRIDAISSSNLPRLLFSPLVCLEPAAPAHVFTDGLNEELSQRLHTTFLLRMGTPGVDEAGADAPPQAEGFVLEGAVRQDAQRIRVSLRVRDLALDAVVWGEQIDHLGDLSISSQEQLAQACLSALLRQPWRT